MKIPWDFDDASMRLSSTLMEPVGLPWCLPQDLMVLSWDNHGYYMTPMEFPCCLHGITVGRPWCFHGTSMGLPWGSIMLRWDTHGTSVVLSWDFHASFMAL